MNHYELESKRKELGKLLKEKRQFVKLKKIELSRLTNLSRPAIDRIENGGNYDINSYLIYITQLGIENYLQQHI